MPYTRLCTCKYIAHELRAWLLHYSPIVLHGILFSDYYQHHLLLIEGVYLLLKQVVSQEDIEQSSRLLKHYCFMFTFLYGKCILISLHLKLLTLGACAGVTVVIVCVCLSPR